MKPDFESAQQLTPFVDRKWRDRTAMHPDSARDKYEFFQFEKQGGNFRWYYHRRKPAMELINEVPAHGLSSFELYGRRWLMPDKADEILTRIYGNWRKPDPNYVYWRDCGATIDRYPWSGERRPVD